MTPEAFAAVDEQVRFRLAMPGDAAFIADSWLRSYRKSADHIPGPVYYAEHRHVIEGLLPKCTVQIAHHAEDVHQILGWCAVQRIALQSGNSVWALHYCYVKQPFRRLGIASRLLAGLVGAGDFCSHQTAAGAAVARRLGLVFNPYLAGVLP